MLSHYIEIKILPDPEFSESMLMGALLNKLHRALIELNTTDIGVAWPEYQLKPKSLGGRLRIHSSAAQLDMLMGLSWLKGMSDHTQCSDITEIPKQVEYLNFNRKQYKTNADRLRRRRMKRKGESYEEALAHIPVSIERKSDLPFVGLRSQSTGQSFQLFINRSDVVSEPQVGQFNSYGLSPDATVPWF